MKRVLLGRFFRNALFIVVVVPLCLLTVIPIGAAYLFTSLSVNGACGNPTNALPNNLPDAALAQDVQITTPEFILDAWYVAGQSNAGVIVLPGLNGGRDAQFHEAVFLHEAGYHVLAVELRTCADPPQKSTLGHYEADDLSYAIDWLVANTAVDPQKIGAFGHSVGGASVIMGAARDARLQAIVATGNYSALDDLLLNDQFEGNLIEDWVRFWLGRFYEWETGISPDDVRPIDEISRISPRAVFLIHGTRENQADGRHQYDAADEPKALWIVQGATHGGYLAVEPAAYPRRIIEFFDEYLQ